MTLLFAAAVLPAAGASPRSPLEALAFLSGPGTARAHGYPWEVWTVPTAGGAPRQLTRLNEDPPRAAWSADRTVVLVRGLGALYAVDSANGDTARVSRDGAHGGLDWSSVP